MSALEHDERCERTPFGLSGNLTVLGGPCSCAARALTASRQREEEAKGEIARLKRLECMFCGRSPLDEPSLILTRINPKGVRGVFVCQDHRGAGPAPGALNE